MAKKQKSFAINGQEMPQSTARPLGTPAPKKSRKQTQKVVDTTQTNVIDFPSDGKTANEPEPETAITPAPDSTTQSEQSGTEGRKTMTLTLKGFSKNGKAAMYSGAKRQLRFPIDGFEGGSAPQTLEIPEGIFAVGQARQKLTPEERKAARAAKPKLTLAEKIAKREEALARLKAKAQAEQAAQAGTTSL
jgi:hypothetical protein